MEPSGWVLVLYIGLLLPMVYPIKVFGSTLDPLGQIKAFDTPNDAGGSITVTWPPHPADSSTTTYQIYLREFQGKKANLSSSEEQNEILVEEFQANTHFTQDVNMPWWSQNGNMDDHYYVIRTRNGLSVQDGQDYAVRLILKQGEEQVEAITPPTASTPNWINWNQLNNFIFVVAFGLVLFGCIQSARRAQAQNREIFLRRIPGLDAVDEAIGRATELGKPILFLTGAGDMGEPSTLAAAVILGRVSKRVAVFETDLLVPHRDPIVMAVCQEITKQSYLEAGKPDAFKEDSNFFITTDQFSYTAAVDGIMLRKKPAANFFMGSYYAESLLLTETGASTGAIQIAGTDSDHQMPFFVTTCDYTLIGKNSMQPVLISRASPYK